MSSSKQAHDSHVTYFTLLLDQPGAFPETMLLQWIVKTKERTLISHKSQCCFNCLKVCEPFFGLLM